MRNSAHTVIYVGKAKILRNRVRSYFGDISDAHLRTQRMVSQVVDFDIIVVDREMEALALEATLIKRYKPKYNILLRDDKSYPYIKITLRDRFPKIAVVRGTQQLLDGSRYFGPYTNVGAMWDVVRLVRRVFKLRQEVKNSPQRRSGCSWDENAAAMKRPCLDYDIRQCTAPCTAFVSPEEYHLQVVQAVLFLEGKMDSLITQVSEEMAQAAAGLHFEAAARLRDKLYSLQQLHQDAEIVSAKHEDMDVIASFARADEACITVSVVRDGKLIDQQHHLLDGVTGVNEHELLSAFLTQRYTQVGTPPRLICLPVPLSEQRLLEEWLSEKRLGRVRILIPKHGAKANVLQMTRNNAEIYLSQLQAKKSEEARKAEEALQELRTILHLPEAPKRIECYDISTLQGEDAVGSMVVFSNGLADKGQYRRFKIRYHSGAPDDYAMMLEMLQRRIGAAALQSRGKNNFATLPDLFVIDGGKGQLSMALTAMAELQLQIPVIGLAKRFEEIFIPGKETGLMLPRNSRALHLLQCLRDEAHRFALKYHTTLRNKRVKESLLDEIPGVGERRKQILLNHFGSIEKIRLATLQEIAQTPGIPATLAEHIFRVLAEVSQN